MAKKAIKKKKKKAVKKEVDQSEEIKGKSLPTTGITIEYINKRVDDSNKYYEENFAEKVQYADNVYHGIKERGEEMEDWQSNLNINIAFGLCNQELPTLMSGLYPKGDFWSLSPVSIQKGSLDLQGSAKAWQAIMEKQAEDMYLYRTFYWAVLDSLKRPMGIWKLNWKFDYEEHKFLDMIKAKVETSDLQFKISRPEVTSIAFEQFFFDKDAETRESWRYAGEFGKTTVGDIKYNPKSYNGDDVGKFLSWARENELEDDDEVDTVEFWERNRVAVTVNNMFVVKDHHTYMKNNHIPYYFFTKFPESREVTGTSTIEAIADNVEYINFIVNQQADNIKLMNNKQFTMKSSSDIDTKTLRSRPGGIHVVKNTEELQEIQMSPLPVNVYNEIGQHQQFITQTIGGMDVDMFADDTQKTATEARLDASTKIMKQKEYVTYNREMVKVFLRDWLELNQQFITKEDAVNILGEELASKLKLETDAVDLNTKLEVRITGDPGIVDRATAMQDINEFAQAMVAVSNLQGVVDIPKVVQFLISKFPDLPKDIVINMDEEGQVAEESPQDNSQSIVDEIKRTAEGRGVTPKVLLEQLAEKLGMDVQTLMQEINRAGSMNAYLEQVKQAQEGGNAKI